jgi:hypothetical protein
MLPLRFDQIAVSLETLLDLYDVSLDELIGRLKPVEEKMNRGEDSLAKLSLTEDELVARLSSHLKTPGSGAPKSSMEASSGSKRGCGRNSSSRGTADRDSHSGGNGGRGNNSGGITGDECRYCEKKWHWALECKKKKRDEQAHAMQVVDEGESDLVIACVNVDVE